ncbi:hypothetical protein NX059_003364 [Plenodomus lindquistii]|nr:hypothetical protein NX059_003364 [Plenodomus lindquistii]
MLAHYASELWQEKEKLKALKKVPRRDNAASIPDAQQDVAQESVEDFQGPVLANEEFLDDDDDDVEGRAGPSNRHDQEQDVSQDEPEEEEGGPSVTAPVPSAPRGRRGRPKNTTVKRMDPLAIAVRNSANDGWEDATSMSVTAQNQLNRDNKRMASGTKNLAADYARFFRSKDLSGAHCIQCQVVAHKKNVCGLNDAMVACTSCVKQGRACAKLIMRNGVETLAFLPLPEEYRGQVWGEIEYWKRQPVA